MAIAIEIGTWYQLADGRFCKALDRNFVHNTIRVLWDNGKDEWIDVGDFRDAKRGTW